MTSSLNKLHRRVWHEKYGDIPVDENGMSYEIHHVNGDHNDNRIENLKCVSVSEHFNIHYQQGDWGACRAIKQRVKAKLGKNLKSMYLSGDQHPMYGKKHTDETRKK